MNSRLDAAMSQSAVRELAAAAAALVAEHDVLGSVTGLLAGCQRCLRADGSGIVVLRPGDRRMEFLAATSHRAEDIELYQAQIDQGPAADTLAGGQSVSAGSKAFADRWPELADRFHARGFRSVYAHPMAWHGQTFGAVNLFFAGDEVAEGIEPVAQTFSDLATVVIAQTGTSGPADLAEGLRSALADRNVIEQAKGVVAYTDDLSVDAAFERLLALARTAGRPLSEVAAGIVDGLADPQATRPRNS
ncbi:ANTAR domain-containing protein [Kribbella sp. NPDC051620]|uniref:ANTAR domain-containing protein n=1 Tax=Kribbella sp. NPDC051620 TaxID=3364120 RepID=UPI0037B66A1A